MEEDPNDIILCGCSRCKFQTRRRRRIVIDHIQKYGQEDFELYNAWYDARARGENAPSLDITPDPRASSTHHKKARRAALELAGSSTAHLTGLGMDVENIEDTIFEEGIQDMLNDFFGDVLPPQEMQEDANAQSQRLHREKEIKDQCGEMLYEGANISKLMTVLAFLNLQSVYGWSDASVTALFKLVKQILPEGNCMPESRTTAKKTLSALGLDYESIHACPNDHVLFRKEFANDVECPKCGASRYRQDAQGDRVPCKVLRHFPLIPRIKHMFRCKEIAGLMSWHADNRSTDGILRVPADSQAWKHIETEWPIFEREPRHLRLGFASDGVNPFGLRSTKWSTWPVVLVNYNIPPWLSIKKGHLILSLLIPGKRKVKDMSVYLAPLIDELQQLWRGIEVVDNAKKGRYKVFNAKAIVMWTMHDYPGYGDISKYSVQGYCACPICGPNFKGRFSRPLSKMVYEGHTRFLPEGHEMRGRDRRLPPQRMTVGDWRKLWDDANETNLRVQGMKGLNAFYALPYWENLLINHLLDPMHCFKNVAVAIWQHLNGQKDNANARADLKVAKIMRRYWPQDNGDLPDAPWILKKQEKIAVKKILEQIRTPTGTMHSLKDAFTSSKEKELSGFKSHDWHKMLQFILPIGISGVGANGVRKCIYNLSALVRWISSKEIDISSIEKMRVLSIETVCMIEKTFPTSILTIQVHILVHLVDEIALAGIVSTRWMFYLERFMKTLKAFVRQKARPEGSMAEGWLVQESCVWITEYIGRIDRTMPLLWTTKDDDRMVSEVRQGKGLRFRLTSEQREKIQLYCIANTETMEKWHLRYEIARNNDASLPLLPSHDWLQNTILKAEEDGELITTEELDFAYGCDWHAFKLSAIWSRGRHFRVHHIDNNRLTYDSGVSASFTQQTTATSGNLKKFTYYGHIHQIIGVGYRSFELIILDVKWYQSIEDGPRPSIKFAENGFPMVDISRVWVDGSDTFVFPNQCDQVFYHPVYGRPNWMYAVDVAPRSVRILQDRDEDAVEKDVDVDLDSIDEDVDDELLLHDSTSNEDTSSEGGLDNIEAPSEDDTTSQNTIGLNLEIILEIDHQEIVADIQSVP